MTAYMRTAVIILAGAALLGCATTAENAKSKPAVTAATIKNPNCLTETGSRIAATGASQCRGFGRSYSSVDIDRTGQTSAADALAQLDPSITVHR